MNTVPRLSPVRSDLRSNLGTWGMKRNSEAGSSGRTSRNFRPTFRFRILRDSSHRIRNFTGVQSRVTSRCRFVALWGVCVPKCQRPARPAREFNVCCSLLHASSWVWVGGCSRHRPSLRPATSWARSSSMRVKGRVGMSTAGLTS